MRALHGWGWLTLVLVLALMPQGTRAADNQLWLSAMGKLWQSEDKKTWVSWYGESRSWLGSEEEKEVFGVFHGPVVRYKAHPNLLLGAGYKFIRFRNSAQQMVPMRRSELEFSPRFSVGELQEYKFDLRTRLELIERPGSDRTRLRYRFRVQHSIDNSSWLRGLFASHELIYLYQDRKHTLNQYRLVPLGAKVKINDSLSLSVFYMINRFNRADDQYRHALGLSFSF